MKIEDPTRQIGYLQQCLSTDKKPLGFFLGAGCPMAIKAAGGGKSLIPDIAGITLIIREELKKCEECGPLLSIIDNNFKIDQRSNTTVEDMLTHIRTLRVVAGKDEVRGFTADQLDKLDNKICQLIHQVVDKALPDDNSPYHSIASWVDAVRRENPVEIFTTNYDLLMEQAFEDSQVPYFDGFAGVQKPFFDLRAMEEDMLPPRWARLWKLHGSINWYQEKNRGVFRGSTQEKNVKRVIHPSHLKYQESRRMPYLAMIDRLRAFLKQPTSTLIICGYSFRDEHINEAIVQGLQSSQNTIAFALIYGNISGYKQATDLARKCSNLNILACDAGVICKQDAKWPERDAESVEKYNIKWIKWTPIIPKQKNSKMKSEFVLGDFALFGSFLQELVGDVRQLPEVTSAH